MQTMTKNNENLNIIELFASVQGETSFTGLPTSFIRLAACNLRCTWCDTTYSFGRGESFSIKAIMDKMDEFGCRHICITGGEPLLQENVYPLMAQLCDKDYILSIETGGSLCTSKIDPRVHIILDVKCPGSGMQHKNYWPNLNLIRPIDQVKFVIQDASDYAYCKQICQEFKLFQKTKEILLSPVHGILNSQELVKWILEDRLNVRLNLQIHKFIWSPETKGV